MMLVAISARNVISFFRPSLFHFHSIGTNAVRIVSKGRIDGALRQYQLVNAAPMQWFSGGRTPKQKVGENNLGTKTLFNSRQH
jgi:hypothetical protein